MVQSLTSERYKLSPAITVKWLQDGDHSFKPRKASGTTEAENRRRALKEIEAFLRGLASTA